MTVRGIGDRTPIQVKGLAEAGVLFRARAIDRDEATASGIHRVCVHDFVSKVVHEIDPSVIRQLMTWVVVLVWLAAVLRVEVRGFPG